MWAGYGQTDAVVFLTSLQTTERSKGELPSVTAGYFYRCYQDKRLLGSVSVVQSWSDTGS